jgi:hypothetical protein
VAAKFKSLPTAAGMGRTMTARGPNAGLPVSRRSVRVVTDVPRGAERYAPTRNIDWFLETRGNRISQDERRTDLNERERQRSPSFNSEEAGIVDERFLIGRIAGLQIFSVPQFGTRASFRLEYPAQDSIAAALPATSHGNSLRLILRAM